jgi:putative DNA primase/helicase
MSALPAGQPSGRPVPLRVIPANIPAELTKLPQWVLWRYELRDGKWTKPPFRPEGKYADSTDPDTWSPFETVLAAYLRGGFAGIGFAPTPRNNLTAGDADHCRDPRTGATSGPAIAALLELDTYTEVSPSAAGARAVAFGKKPGRNSKRGDFELYDGQTRNGKPAGRFLTFTGHRLDGSPSTINERQQQINRVYKRMLGDKPRDKKTERSRSATLSPVELTDDELMRRMFANEKNGPAIRALFAGDTSAHGGDESRADSALCFHLAFWCNRNAERVERLFDLSKLAEREKWANREDYRQRTIETAVAEVSHGYEPRPTAGELFIGNSTMGRNSVTSVGTESDGPRTGAQIILAHFRELYRPVFKRGTAAHCTDGAVVTMGEGCALCDSELIAKLATASDVPRYAAKPGEVGPIKYGSLPAFFGTWAKVAWGDLLRSLPDEDAAELGEDGPAREDFRRMVSDAMLSQIVLGDVIRPGKTEVTQTERRSIIDWCHKFAKPKLWKSIRSYKCWCKIEDLGDGQIRLKVAIRHELFAQLKADRDLCKMGTNKFTRRAARYGVGGTSREDRPQGKSAVVLDDTFVAGLLEGMQNDTEEATDFGSVPKSQNSELHPEPTCQEKDY